MKKILPFAIIMSLVLLVLSGCGNNAGLPEPIPQPEPPPVANISMEEALAAIDVAADYYPSEVVFEFSGLDQIESHHDGMRKYSYVFDVLHEDRKVSGAAIGAEDGRLWILDMNSGRWFNSEFINLSAYQPLPEFGELELEPIIDIISYDRSVGHVATYIAMIDAIPEFSNINEGVADWFESEQTVVVRAIKGTGSVTGTIDGPSIRLVVTWASGEPEIVVAAFDPAPVFSHPNQVLRSGEVMDIEEYRLIEIAEYFRDLVREEAGLA